MSVNFLFFVVTFKLFFESSLLHKINSLIYLLQKLMLFSILLLLLFIFLKPVTSVMYSIKLLLYFSTMYSHMARKVQHHLCTYFITFWTQMNNCYQSWLNAELDPYFLVSNFSYFSRLSWSKELKILFKVMLILLSVDIILFLELRLMLLSLILSFLRTRWKETFHLRKFICFSTFDPYSRSL